MQVRRIGIGMALVALGVSVICQSASASPSGLNNTPTADTCPARTLVLQGWAGFGEGQHPDWWTGAKFGLFKGAEVGVDWDADGNPSRHAQFQAKYGLDLGNAGTRVAAGIANVSDDTDRNGDVFPYAVLTQNVNGWFRIHLGYEFQKDNHGVFGGVDTTVGILGRDVLFCADATQINDGDDTIIAPGVKFGLGAKDANGKAPSSLDAFLNHFVFETWATFSTVDDADVNYVTKLNVVLGF